MTVLMLTLGGPVVPAQTAVPDSLRFEVASVKPRADTGSTVAGIEDNESVVRIGNLPLRTVIAIAYGVMDSRVAGPGWLDPRRGNADAGLIGPSPHRVGLRRSPSA